MIYTYRRNIYVDNNYAVPTDVNVYFNARYVALPFIYKHAYSFNFHVELWFGSKFDYFLDNQQLNGPCRRNRNDGLEKTKWLDALCSNRLLS